MKALVITLLIVGGLFLSYDLFVATPESRDVFSTPAETYDPIATIPIETPPADPLAEISPEVVKKVEQFEAQPLSEAAIKSPAIVVKAEDLISDIPRSELEKNLK